MSTRTRVNYHSSKSEIVAELEQLLGDTRPGTADSNINVLALIGVPTSLVLEAISEIEHLRFEVSRLRIFETAIIALDKAINGNPPRVT